ncbi:hypothetical protein MKW98_026048 [Papaver atlanticum]|uniref:RING-type domain-containing protein n=1 Tax=Papaver atlanticum TaxID=357466 RepID=A0AAD4RXY3_9MAGN|nr:hypothetical protein MKW98_026048 [Papaver atlanticum]
MNTQSCFHHEFEKRVMVKKNINFGVNIQWFTSIYLILLLLPYTSAQSDNDRPPLSLKSKVGYWVAVSICCGVMILCIVYIGFLICLCCYEERGFSVTQQQRQQRTINHVLKIFGQLTQFLVFLHPDVKNKENVIECAVCLENFKDGDELRLVLPCNHVFHTKCIDP